MKPVTLPSCDAQESGSISVPTTVTIAAEPLTTSSFSPFGQVIAGPQPASPSASSMPYTLVNQGSASKYSILGRLQSLFEHRAEAQINFHIYRCNSIPISQFPLGISMLERHSYSSQSFVPLASPSHPGRYLIVVALNGADDRPDLFTLRAFLAESSQAFVYRPGTWHLPMTPIGGEEGAESNWLDFACIVAESASMPELNCEEYWWPQSPAAHIRM